MQRVFGDVDALRFVDDRLDPDRRSAFAAYLAENAEEFERVQLWTRQNEALRSAFGSAAGEPAPAWLMPGTTSPVTEPSTGSVRLQAVVSALPVEAKLSRPVPPSTRLPQSWDRGGLIGACVGLLAVAALALTAADGFALVQGAGARSGDSGIVARAADAFRTYATDPVRPVEIPAGQDMQLQQWILRRTALPVRPPDLRPEGWSFLGGRVIPGDTGPGAMLVYENGGKERLALFFGHTSAPPQSDAQVDSFPGGSILWWTSGSDAFAVAAEKDADWIGREGDPLRAKIEGALQPTG